MPGNFGKRTATRRIEHPGVTAGEPAAPDITIESETVSWLGVREGLRGPLIGAACLTAVALGAGLMQQGSLENSITTGSTASETSLTAEEAEQRRIEREPHWQRVNEAARRKQQAENEADMDSEERLIKASRTRAPVTAPPIGGRPGP